MDNIQQALQPCPFCGKSHTLKISAASAVLWDEEQEGYPYPHSESYAATCDASRPHGPGGCGASGGYFPAEAEAIAAWNRRLSLPVEAPSDLHAAIMNLPCRPTDHMPPSEAVAYKEGHRDARHAAAELVAGIAGDAAPQEQPQKDQVHLASSPNPMVRNSEAERSAMKRCEPPDEYDELRDENELRLFEESARLMGWRTDRVPEVSGSAPQFNDPATFAAWWGWRASARRFRRGAAAINQVSHDYPACALFRGGKCTCD